jgi:DNA repair exonuclease SbcCD ATPase subunit
MQLAFQKEADKYNYKKAQVRTLQASVNEMQKAFQSLKKHTEKQEKLLKATHAAEVAVKSQIDVYRQNAIEMSIKVNEVIKEKQEIAIRLSVAHSDLKRSIDNFEELQKKIKEDRSRQIELLAIQETQLQAKEIAIKDLRSALDTAEAALKELQGVNGGLKEKLEGMEKEREKLMNMLLASAGDSALMMVQKTQRISELEEQLMIADETYVQLHLQQTEVDNLRKRTTTAEEAFHKMQTEVTTLKANIAHLEDFTNLLDLQNTAVKSELKFEKDAGSLLKHELQGLKRDHSRGLEALTECKKEVCELKKKLGEVKAEVRTKQLVSKCRECADLKQDVTRERLDKSVIAAEVSESVATMEYYGQRTKELEEMEARLAVLKRQELELRGTVEKLEVANESLESELCCPVCLNLLEDSLLAYPCSHSYCSHCAPPLNTACVVCDAKIVRYLKCKLLDQLSAKITYKRQALSALRQLLIVC